jgi:NADH:ubiquinone oxidoreductase subunit 5 (subunit L)/multisubunit Na+/H+ antiporter MnhA subunit
MGLITIAFGIGLFMGNGASAAAAGVLLYAFHHALAKGALFLGVGVVGGTKGRSTKRVWVTALLGIAALALAGAPLTTGAVAKTALKTAMVHLPGGVKETLAILLPFSAIGTTMLMARFFYTLQTYTAHHSVSKIEFFSWIGLLALSATLLFLFPDARQAADAMLKPGSVWLSFWPVAAGAGAAAAVWFWSRRTGRSISWCPPAGDLLVPVERLSGAAGRLAATLTRKTEGVLRTLAQKQKEGGARGIPGRIEAWEAGFSRWNRSGLIFAGVVCALLLILRWP